MRTLTKFFEKYFFEWVFFIVIMVCFAVPFCQTVAPRVVENIYISLHYYWFAGRPTTIEGEKILYLSSWAVVVLAAAAVTALVIGYINLFKRVGVYFFTDSRRDRF